jgi:YVTN family beta-propeller protein
MRRGIRYHAALANGGMPTVVFVRECVVKRVGFAIALGWAGLACGFAMAQTAGAGRAAQAGVATPPAPAAAAVAPAARPAVGQRPILVLNSLDADVSVIDPVSFRTIKRVPTGKEPHHLYLTPDEKSVIVANAGGNSLTFLDPATGDIQRTLRNIVDPYHLRFSPDMKWFVTAANRLNHVDIYRWQPNDAMPLVLAKRIATGKVPSHLAIDSKSTVVYVSVQDSNQLMAIDLATQAPRWTVATGKMPADVFLLADDKTLLLGLTGDKVVQVWDVSANPAKLIKQIPTGAGAHAFRARGDKRHVFVSNRVANTISMIDTQSLSVVAELPGPGGPDCMEVLADGRTLLVSSRWARKLSFIDIESRKLLRQVDVGASPHGVWTLDHAGRQ